MSQDKLTQEEEAMPGSSAEVKRSFYRIVSDFLRSKMGRGTYDALAKTEVEAPAPVEEARKFPYIVRINTGAGVIKARVNAATQKEAIEMAKIDYVRRLSVTAELYDRP